MDSYILMIKIKNIVIHMTKQTRMKISSMPCRFVANFPPPRTNEDNKTRATRTPAPAMCSVDLLSCDKLQVLACALKTSVCVRITGAPQRINIFAQKRTHNVFHLTAITETTHRRIKHIRSTSAAYGGQVAAEAGCC